MTTHDQQRVVPRRHPWRTCSIIIILLLMVVVLGEIATNPNMGWDVVFHYLFSPSILSGVVITIFLSVISMIIALLIGALLAAMMLSKAYTLSYIAKLYIWFFRGTPLLVQLIFWFNIGFLFPNFIIGIPFTETIIFSISANALISGFIASILGLTLHEAAYLSEIIRSGLLSVERGQTEAAEALGMPGFLLWRRVVLPQAMRVIVPPVGNRSIVMLQNTSLVAVISGGDLLTNAQNIYSQTFQVIPLLIVASIWYLAITTVSMAGQRILEKKYSRGY